MGEIGDESLYETFIAWRYLHDMSYESSTAKIMS